MTSKYKKSLLFGVAICFVGISTAPVALAQESSSTSGAVDTITVTARRREENLQDTPVSIAAYSGEMLEDRQIYSTDSLDEITPGLQFANNAPLAGNNASSQIFIRGIGQTDPTSTVDPGVGIYIDGVYMGQSVGGTMDFRDIAGVQVLRGPQGALFGRNTIGGAIVLTTTEPGDEFGGSARIRAGTDNLVDVFAAVDVPISETLLSRFTFGTRRQDGYVTRRYTGEDLGDTNNWLATAKFVFEPTDNFSARLNVDYSRSDENGSPLVFAASNETAAFQRAASADAGCPGIAGNWLALPAVPMIDDPRCANDFQAGGPFINNGTYDLTSQVLNWGVSLTLDYDVNDQISLKSITSSRELNWLGIRDADNTPLTILHTNYDSRGEQFSQEFQLLYTGEKLNGVAGYYYATEDVVDIVFVQLNTPAPGEQGDSDNTTVNNSNWAVFSQWTYDFDDHLQMTVGGRYTEDTKGSTPDQFNYATPTVPYLPVRLYETTFTDFTPSATLSYRWNDEVMTYLSYSQGFKGGGWNAHFNAPQTQAQLDDFHSFDQEQASTIELGFKLDLLGRALRLNGAVFTTDYSDLQITYRQGVAPYITNAGQAEANGFELELTWVPDDAWTINAGLGYLDATITELAPIAGLATGVIVGNALPYAPEWQGNIGIGRSDELSGGWMLDTRLDVSYKSETFFDANNTVEIAQLDPVTLVNLSVNLAAPGDDWRLLAGIRNATDEIYPIAGNSSLGTGSGYAEIAYDRGRQWFIGLEADF
ncbi:TonB-dependent receptor [Hyphomonas sp.]|jgi:iron complex outermembrane receptor protein|uniref:TonB-dependent receptor n=1 Tax=Hyphomonas sp. TaxID=87 RepID=UPI0039E66C7E